MKMITSYINQMSNYELLFDNLMLLLTITIN